MKYLFISILLLAAACDSCRNLDCVGPPFDNFTFTYTNEAGNDLLSGASQKYEVEEIKIYALDEFQNKVYPLIAFETSTPSTKVHVQLNYTMEQSFLEVKGEVTDTLDFDFNVQKTECCGTMRTIKKTTLNGEVYTGEFPIPIKERE